MEKKRFAKPRLSQSGLLAVIVILTMITLATTLFILAKYRGTTGTDGTVNLQGFDVDLVYDSTNALEIDSDTGVITLTPKQYKDFILSVSKTGDGWAYARVVIDVSWVKREEDDSTGTTIITDTVVPTGTSGTLVINTSEIGSYATDDYYYVKGILKKETDIPVIVGENTIPDEVKNAAANTTYVAKLSVKVEAVQYNRLEAIWDILPSAYPQ